MTTTPERLDDPDDPRLSIYKNLKATNETRWSNQFVVEGLKLVERLRESRFPLVSIIASEKAEDAARRCAPEGVPLYLASQQMLESLVGYNFHRGVLAAGRRVAPPPLDALIDAAGRFATLVVCPRIDNPENLGSIIRIADVFGAIAVLTGARAPDPLSRRVLRVSMGTSLDLPTYSCDDLAATMTDLRDRRSFSMIATVCAGAAERLDQFLRPARLALLLGSEGDGLEPEWLALCDRRLNIPMRDGAESLNVSVAAGIVLFALSIQAPGLPQPDDRDSPRKFFGQI